MSSNNALIIQHLVDVIMEDESESESEEDILITKERKNYDIPRNYGYAEETVPRMSISTFRSHFRLYPETVRVVESMIAQDPAFIDKSLIIDLDKQLLMTLWVLASQDSFRSVAEKFAVAKSTAYFTFERVCSAIARLSTDVIKWPTLAEMNTSAIAFEANAGFPDVIGCVDGTHIEIRRPENHADVYINRHNYASLVLQAIVNHNMEFINCYAGEVGSQHDATIFGNSPIGQALRNRVPENYHLLGDSAYPLSLNLMTPFKDNGHLTRDQITYNYKLSSTRSIVERSFGLLKGRFRRLKYLDCTKTEFVPTIIMATCVLHNITRRRQEEIDENVSEETEHGDDDEDEDENHTPSSSASYNAAAHKRQALVQYVNT